MASSRSSSRNEESGGRSAPAVLGAWGSTGLRNGTGEGVTTGDGAGRTSGAFGEGCSAKEPPLSGRIASKVGRRLPGVYDHPLQRQPHRATNAGADHHIGESPPGQPRAGRDHLGDRVEESATHDSSEQTSQRTGPQVLPRVFSPTRKMAIIPSRNRFCGRSHASEETRSTYLLLPYRSPSRLRSQM